MASCGSAFLSAAVTRVHLQEALIKVCFVKIPFVLVLLVPAQFEHGVKLEDFGQVPGNVFCKNSRCVAAFPILRVV